MDRLLRTTYRLFDFIYYINHETDEALILYGTTLYDGAEAVHVAVQGVKAFRQWLGEHEIYGEDCERFYHNSEPSMVCLNTTKAPGGCYETYYRMRSGKDHYSWVKVIHIPTGGNGYIVFFREVSEIIIKDEYEIFLQSGFSEKADVPEKKEISIYDLWETFMQYGDFNFFWKDKDRRFLGVSRSFLRFYNLKDMSEVLGKTDEDMGWHVDNDPFRNDEYQVIHDGVKIVNSHGRCIANGKLHNILATKLPIYHMGEIVGLAGYFIDAERLHYNDSLLDAAKILDPITGLINVNTFFSCVRDYVDNRDRTGEDFALIRFHIHGCKLLKREFGLEGLNICLEEMGHRINAGNGQDAIISWYGGGDMLAIKKGTPKEIEEYARKIKKIVENVREVKDISCTFYVSYESMWYHDSTDIMDFLMKVNSLHPELHEYEDN